MSLILPSIGEFNQLQIESQQSIISSQLKSKINEVEKANLIKVLNLLAYLNENNDQQGKHLFSIASQNKEINLAEVIYKINEIELSYQATEVLQTKNKLKSTKFENYLSNFGTVLFELKYKSLSFDDSYNQILSLKTKISTRTRIIISIGFGTFNECSLLTQIVIPSSVNIIESAAFKGCNSLTQVSVPSSVVTINDSSFQSCSSLKKILFLIPSSLTTIGNYAFSECTSLAQITIPSSVTSIGEYAFNECSSLKQISFMIPFSMSSIGTGAFKGCSSLLQLTIPSYETEKNSYLLSIDQIKKLADEGDINMMYLYGRKKFNGEDDCQRDIEEAKKYINMAAEKDHQNAKLLSLIINDNLLIKNVAFIIKKVKENYDQITKKVHNFANDGLCSKSFIFTQKAIERLTTLYYYLKSGVPVLLEGPTGTSKTLSSEIICKLTRKQFVKFDFCSETKASDLLGRYNADVDSWAGLSMAIGPFRYAYENGCILLLNNINLASNECLKFIGDALDSKKISVEMPGMPLREIPMHPDFRLIATQNPNKGLFAAKRQDLDPAFLSRFQIIDFPSFGKDELVEIAKRLAKSFQYNASDQFIQDFVDFHMTWSSRDDVKGDVQCFTIREIAAAVHALANGNNCYDTIMTIYGARYKKLQKENLKNFFLSFESFKDMKPSKFEYPYRFPKCFHNNNLEEALKAIKFSFQNRRHVILTGSEGNGITQVARWVSQFYNKTVKNNDELFFICTEETKCSDLIGSLMPSDNIGSEKALIVFKLGLLALAIQQGKCVVLDSINEIPSIVCERLNSLFDEKYNAATKVFEIPENPQREPIEIDPDFRMLCTCRIDKINQMSPAFVNRFNVIVLEDQLEDITDDKLKELIELLMKVNLTSSSHSSINSNQEKVNEEEEEEDFDIGELEEEEPDDIIANNQTTNNGENTVNAPIEFKPSSDLIDLVFNSFKQIKKETLSNDEHLATMFKLSRLCKAVSKYVNLLSGITQEKIVKFATDFVMKTNDFDVPKEIEDFFIKRLVAANYNDDGQYFFEDSPPLRSHIAKLYAASVINQPIVVYGGTGVGKTSAARAFGRLRRNQQNRSLQCLMLSFYAGTKSNNIYGTTAILNGKVAFVNGPLTTALKNGCTFIADEMNLSTISTMKSLAPALEPCIGEKIFISGVGESIKIHPDFFFVACQNELGTIGRNVIPSSIASRFRVLYYPVLQHEDISTICVDISNNLYHYNSSIKPSFTLNDARNVGKYMINLNHEMQKIIPQWSLRDVTKLFKRIHHQDEQNDDYKGITFYYNVLFYTLASVDKSELQEIFDTVLELIGNIFILHPEKRNKLKNSYLAEPSIQNFGKGSYIMKGDIGISTTLFPNFEHYIQEFSGLPSLLECIFQILLSDSSEPILLMGPSGYKMFISKLYLQKAKVIASTQETSVSQLIGSSAFLTKSEAKHFYLDLIFRICHIYDGKKITELKDKLSKRKLVKSDISAETKTYLQIYPSFATTVHRLTEKLFNNSIKGNDQNVLSNMVIEFRPGLILLPILQGDCIILKDISNLQTTVIERFNELLTGKHNITVFEDIHDTITKSDQKELSGFSSFSRVFGTCPPNSAVKLSEDVLSGFTVINTSEYKKDEQENALKSYNIINSKNLSNEIIDLIIEFSKSVQIHLKKTMPFTQLINILEICSRLIRTISSIPPKNILGIVLYRIFVGLLERRTEYKEKINTIFNEINVPLPSQFLNPNNESPFLITNKDGFPGLESKITGLHIHSTSVNDVDLNVAYTPTFVDMLDIIHFGISAKIPVILEGNAGQRKQKAIEYVAKHLGYEVNNIVLSKSTKVDDLLGKVSIEPDERNNIHVNPNFTKLAKAIKSNSANNNTIFVLHNLNNASPAVLEKLTSLFDCAQNEFSLPDGTTHQKGEINVIGLFNPQNGISNREKLPTSLIYSSIYHIVENPKKSDVLNIIQALFQPTDFRNEVISFHHAYKITKKFASQNNASSAVTLYDISKYIILRTVTNGFLDKDLILKMLFGFRFLQHEINIQVLEELDLLKILQPTLRLNEYNPTIIEKLKTLTDEQGQCLLFLICAVLSKRPCIIQGSTASGKSHIIRLFAKMLGRKLNVYQMNSDSNMSIFTGQSIVENEITAKDEKEFLIAFSDLQAFDELKAFIKKIFSIPYKEWKPKQFCELLEKINSYEKNESISDNSKELLQRAKEKIKQTMSPCKRSHHVESAFIRAMENGEWVVLEDLGSAPPEIEEKLSFLCGDDPEIDLFESGENNFFSRNKPNSRKIHEDFQIFITYNPSSNTTYRELSPNFLNKCFLFTLPPLDSTNKSSEEFLKGAFINYKYDNNLANILGKGISNVHQFIKKDCLNNKDSYATATQFTARTLTFILKEFDRHIKKHGNSIESIYKVLCRSFHLYYLNSYINTNKDIIQKQMIEELSKEIDITEFDDKIDDVVKKEETFSEVAYINYAQINEELKRMTYDDSEDEDDEVYEINQSDDENIIICRPSGECHQVSVDPEIFDGMIHELNERDGIEQAIHFMKTTDREKTLEILPYTSRTFEMKYLMPDDHLEVDDYPILPLMKQSFKISQEFIKVASDLDLPYSTMCVNILIDCSAFISDENKMFNLLIICGLTDALTTLDIPYSAAVIGDRNFKAIVKPFEEPHSYRALQRISDCIHIKRFRAKLPGCIEYAINSMAFPNDERRNRAIFTFTDGLDENLVKIKGWSELFKYSQLSFGFVFIKSSELVRKNLVFLENIWDTFEKETNGKNSVVKVAKIYANLDTLGYLLELFENVMKRSNRIDDEHMIIDSNYRIPLFKIPEEEKLKSINIFKKYMKEKYDDNKDLYVQRSDVIKNVKSVFDQVDSKLFYNKLNRITTCQVDNSLENEYRDFLKDFIQSGKNINRTSLKKIFKINKAPQANLLTETNIDATALILNLINPVPDPMIYLEEKGGLIRNYGVTVVIDASYSCFNPLSSAHSFQTIKSVLVSLGSIDLPCFDLIIATNSYPIVLCSQLKTSYALAERSQLWYSLFAVLQNIHPSLHHSDLASAIHTAFDLRRMRTMECDSSMMFVLTDGLYQAAERPRIIECVNNCVQFGMITFGIGMGIYPKGIEKLFPQYVFAGNPSNVMKGVSQLFTNNNFDYSDKMFCLSHSFESKDLISAMEQVSRSTERPLFALFCEELSKIIPTIDAFSDFVNEEQDTRKAVKKGFVNPQGEGTELYIKGFLRTQKILIVQLCDDTICGDPQLNKKYIFENYESGRKECINEAVKFFGITLTVVQNYEDAIHEITKSNNDLCEYYAVWIICGRHPEQLPTGQRSSNKYIVEQFIDVLIKFWKNGGSLVFWADNDPYTFHVNLFLNKVRFENEEKCPSGKVNFQIHGNHKGGKNLSGDDFGELKKEQIFNRSQQLFRDLERTKIWHNIAKLNEGKTLSFVENINVKTDSNYKEKILPFKPFAIDSDGGITILFYSANLKTGTGDIIIDCGFSKLFSELNLKGTFRYIQNVAGWTCRPEVHMRLNRGKKPCDWRPKAVRHTITNITSPNYSSFVKDLIAKASNISTISVL